mgnify:CR=1 FL=1
MAAADIPKPAYAHNMRAIGHSDQGGRPDAVQVMVNKGHAFVSHLFSNGFSVIDVRDPTKPRAAAISSSSPITRRASSDRTSSSWPSASSR